MKIAITTCNIGGIDEIQSSVKIKTDKEFEYLYWSENNLPFPLPNLDNRMKGKYLKILSHRFLNNEIFIWMDGCIEILDSTFIDWAHQQIEDCDVVITRHADRDNVYEEIEFILEHMKAGLPYLISRYAKQPFETELKFYREKQLPESVPLFNCFFFIRKNSEKVNKAFEEWWDLTLRYTNFDQAAFSYIAWKHNLKIRTVNADSYIKRHKHNENSR